MLEFTYQKHTKHDCITQYLFTKWTHHTNGEMATLMSIHIGSDAVTVKCQDFFHHVKDSTGLFYIQVTLWFLFKSRIIRFIIKGDSGNFIAEQMQLLTVKLFQLMTFIADNICCMSTWSFILSLIVMSIWHFTFKMLCKSYPDFFKANMLRSFCWKSLEKNYCYNFKS